MSFISGTVGAILGSEAQDNATETNAANVAATNALNYQMFLQSRGSTGHALLPFYFGDEEKNLANNAAAIYDASRAAAGDYDQQLARYQGDVSQFNDMSQEAANTAKGVFDGTLENESLTNFQPVADARVAGAQARKTSGLEALQDTLNEIKAVQAGKGFSGDSFGNRLLETSARRKVYSDAATDMAGVNIQNAQDKFGIQQQAQARRLSNLSLPYAMAQQSINTGNLAQNAVYDQTARGQQLFNFFKMAPGQYTYQPMPTVQPSASPWQAVAAGMGTGNTILAKYLIDKYGGAGGTVTASSGSPSIYDSSSALVSDAYDLT